MEESRHVVARAADAEYRLPPEYRGQSEGFDRWSIVDETHPGAVHTGFGMCRLQEGGSIAPHVHSLEESVYVLEGEVICETRAGAVRLAPGDYGLLPVGVEHRWHNPGSGPVRWAEMLAPQPRSRQDGDTFFVRDFGGSAPVPVDVRDPRTRSLGHIDPENLEVDKQTQDRLAVSASMRTALLVYSGITVEIMVDTDLGPAFHHVHGPVRAGGFAGAHDHPLEETYLILEGGTDATFDGVEYRLEAGDVAFAGVGCVHAFANPGSERVRWLEIQAPGPPARHSYRFARDWSYLVERLG